ncbi:type II toxin-antitoxin system RelE family toxin [Methanocrinis sp.]|uniref:type II toxin-antitoxin system RelE family toxin n=1 Tax=Methanocrinis sp. TaxID=3101522 RepID=UPI003D0F9C59
MYSVIYSPAARRAIKSLPEEAARIFRAVGAIKEDPYSSVKKIKGSAKCPIYSLRVGDYRVIMTIEGDRMIIFVIEVGHRSAVYRKY